MKCSGKPQARGVPTKANLACSGTSDFFSGLSYMTSGYKRLL